MHFQHHWCWLLCCTLYNEQIESCTLCSLYNAFNPKKEKKQETRMVCTMFAPLE